MHMSICTLTYVHRKGHRHVCAQRDCNMHIHTRAFLVAPSKPVVWKENLLRQFRICLI